MAAEATAEYSKLLRQNTRPRHSPDRHLEHTQTLLNDLSLEDLLIYFHMSATTFDPNWALRAGTTHPPAYPTGRHARNCFRNSLQWCLCGVVPTLRSRVSRGWAKNTWNQREYKEVTLASRCVQKSGATLARSIAYGRAGWGNWNACSVLHVLQLCMCVQMRMSAVGILATVT